MSDNQLGRLQKVELREAWLSESNHFTPWLAQCENLELLGEAISIQLECEAQEKNVGPFRADILCKDTATDHWVLIENQLERTDHGHLGQLLTYAAGLEAVTIVWIAERFTDEHRAALDWLNQHTDEGINFFGLEVELWRIGTSPFAPKFNVVCKPNEWTRSIAEGAKIIESGPLADVRQLQLRYWTQFLELMRQRNTMFFNRSPRAASWIGFGIGRTGFRLWVETYPRESLIGAGMTCKSPHGKYHFRLLLNEKDAIEKELGFPLEWDERLGKQYSFIAVYTEANSSDEAQWPVQHQWLAEKVERLRKVMQDRIRALPLPSGGNDESTAADKGDE